MALVRYENADIIVALPDATIQGITLKRKAHVQSINIELEAKRVAMNIKVVYYGTDDQVLNVPGINSYVRPLVADISTIVDAATGVPICESENEYIANPDHVEGDELPATILNPLLLNE